MPNRNLFLSSVLIFVLLIISLTHSVEGSSEMWSQTYGGELDDEATSIVEAEDRGYVIAGTTHSFGAGGADFWLFKTDESGNMLWNRTFGGPENDFAQAMIKTNDGGYVIAGETNSFGAGGSDCWLIKVDHNGNVQWNKTYGESTSDGANAVIQTSDGGYALVGYATDDNASTDSWFVKSDCFWEYAMESNIWRGGT